MKRQMICCFSFLLVLFLTAQTCTTGLAAECVGAGDIVCDETEAYECGYSGYGYYVSRASEFDVEYCGAEETTTDSDEDGLTDYDEINIYGTDPYDRDSDDDLLLDGEEVVAGTDPLDATSGEVTRLSSTLTRTTSSSGTESISSLGRESMTSRITAESEGISSDLARMASSRTMYVASTSSTSSSTMTASSAPTVYAGIVSTGFLTTATTKASTMLGILATTESMRVIDVSLCDDVTVAIVDFGDIYSESISGEMSEALDQIDMLHAYGTIDLEQTYFDDGTNFYDFFMEALEEEYDDQEFTVTATKTVTNTDFDPEDISFSMGSDGEVVVIITDIADVVIDVLAEGDESASSTRSGTRDVDVDFTITMKDMDLYLEYAISAENFEDGFLEWNGYSHNYIFTSVSAQADSAYIRGTTSGGSGFTGSPDVDDLLFSGFSDTSEPYILSDSVIIWNEGEYEALAEVQTDALTTHLLYLASASGQDVPTTNKARLYVNGLTVGEDDVTFTLCKEDITP